MKYETEMSKRIRSVQTCKPGVFLLAAYLALSAALCSFQVVPAFAATKLAPIPGEEILAPNLRRTVVSYRTQYPAGSIIIDTSQRYLYFILGDGNALRYGIAVGREGYQWEGSMRVSKKREWPDWRPPADMRARARKQGRNLPRVVKGGPKNPLGARAIYLGRSEYRIHGTNAPKSIGKDASSGCIRMLNEHVIDLYDRVDLRARVVVLP